MYSDELVHPQEEEVARPRLKRLFHYARSTLEPMFIFITIGIISDTFGMKLGYTCYESQYTQLNIPYHSHYPTFKNVMHSKEERTFSPQTIILAGHQLASSFFYLFHTQDDYM